MKSCKNTKKSSKNTIKKWKPIIKVANILLNKVYI